MSTLKRVKVWIGWHNLVHLNVAKEFWPVPSWWNNSDYYLFQYYVSQLGCVNFVLMCVFFLCSDTPSIHSKDWQCKMGYVDVAVVNICLIQWKLCLIVMRMSKYTEDLEWKMPGHHVTGLNICGIEWMFTRNRKKQFLSRLIRLILETEKKMPHASRLYYKTLTNTFFQKEHFHFKGSWLNGCHSCPFRKMAFKIHSNCKMLYTVFDSMWGFPNIRKIWNGRWVIMLLFWTFI